MVATDPVLEELSDKVRRGEPVSLPEAMAVIIYQSDLKRAQEEELRKTWWGRVKLWWRNR